MAELNSNRRCELFLLIPVKTPKMAADFGILIAEKLLEAIGSEIVKEVCSLWGYKSELKDLEETVSTIQKVLRDAEAKRELSNEEQGYIEKLKDAVYDADDLFDEFRTLAELKQLRPLSKSGKLFEKVRCFFSSKNQVGQAYKMSREVKEIKKRLDVIANNHQKFGFSVDYRPIIRRRVETCSYVDANEIIGREEDKEAIVDMLLNHNNNNNAREGFSFLTIVGVGGLGKTALAQLVYNDEKIKKEFSDLRLWVCVSDQDGQQFDVKAILCKILESITQHTVDGNSTMELVQNQVQGHLRARKYFLVLDDVWNEDREQWLKLKRFLLMGQEGSKIVVTTRSEMTSTIIGSNCAYRLKGLSTENSWRLFEMSAFPQGCEENENYHELVEVGKKIIEKCYKIPLAIKVVGSLLFGHNLYTWRSIEEGGLAQMRQGDNEIMSILKLSYHNLGSSLKSCFSYCAIFPKDHNISKQMLIDLWMAQGYIVPLDRNQSIEEAAEEHFLILLRRCFFQNVQIDTYGDVCFLKIHDLMHDVAQEMRRKEICAVTSITRNLVDKVRHVGCVGNANPEISLGSNRIRSYICHAYQISPVVKKIEPHIAHWMCLRVLTLSGGIVVNLPDSIGKLMLLRYLNLSKNQNLEVLCDSITKLHNLQSLILQGCRNLEELPKDFSKLIKLRCLDLKDCVRLTCMPLGLTKLCSLRVLPVFVVGKKISTEKQSEDELQALKSLTKIKGKLHIKIGKNYRRIEDMNNSGGYLKSTEHLSHVTIEFPSEGIRSVRDTSEGLLQNLEPHPSVKGLHVMYYNGTIIPKWGRAEDNWATSFPHLVSINLSNCNNLQQLPMLSKLPFLKILWLRYMNNIEHMEDARSETVSAELPSFFPSLEVLEIQWMHKLKGWWKGERYGDDDDHHLKSRLIFPRLRRLIIWGCPNLMSLPPCLYLRELVLVSTNEKLEVIVKSTGKDDGATENSHDVGTSKSMILRTDKVGYLKSLPTNHLTKLCILGNGKMESRQSEVEAFQRCASSLQHLTIFNLKQLRILSGNNASGFHHFTALESLTIDASYVDKEAEDKDKDEDEDADDMMVWKSFPNNLRSLEFRYVRKVTTLPRGIQYLTSLQSLSLIRCHSLEVLPEWISCLSSLQYLRIHSCKSLKSLPEAMRNVTSLQSLRLEYSSPELIDRCRAPNGEDYPKIQHIPNVDIFN